MLKKFFNKNKLEQLVFFLCIHLRTWIHSFARLLILLNFNWILTNFFVRSTYALHQFALWSSYLEQTRTSNSVVIVSTTTKSEHHKGVDYLLLLLLLIVCFSPISWYKTAKISKIFANTPNIKDEKVEKIKSFSGFFIIIS